MKRSLVFGIAMVFVMLMYGATIFACLTIPFPEGLLWLTRN